MDDPQAGSREDASGSGDAEIASVELSDGKHLVVRHASAADAPAVHALYERLSTDDLHLRFFQATVPPDQVTLEWITMGERGGVSMVVEVTEPGGAATLVAEAGYSLLDDGDGELAITIDADWRGWLGPWLLDLLVEQAATRGVQNLQAAMLLENRNMRALMAHRGHIAVDHPDWHEVRLAISTDGPIPGWAPKSDRPRLLATAQAARWSGEDEAKKAGFDVRTCPGPDKAVGGCPVLVGDRCPLLEAADAVVFDLPPDTPERSALIDKLKGQPIPVVFTRMPQGKRASPCERASDVLATIGASLADSPPPAST